LSIISSCPPSIPGRSAQPLKPTLYRSSFVRWSRVGSARPRKGAGKALQKARDQLEIKVSERSAALMQTQAELAHLSRTLSIVELTASIAHEINQPLAAVVANGHACIQWLSGTPPNLEKLASARNALFRMELVLAMYWGEFGLCSEKSSRRSNGWT